MTMRATVAGWVGSGEARKRIAFELPAELYDELKAYQREHSMSDKVLLDRITRGGTRKPTEHAVLSVLQQPSG